MWKSAGRLWQLRSDTQGAAGGTESQARQASLGSGCILAQIKWVFMTVLVKLPLEPWQQPKVSLRWRDLTAIGTNNPYATTESVLEGRVHVFHLCEQERGEKSLIFCTPRKNIQDVSVFLLVLSFTCSEASEGLCTVKPLIISLGLLPENITSEPASFVCQEAINAQSVEISLTHCLWFFTVCFRGAFSHVVRPVQ